MLNFILLWEWIWRDGIICESIKGNESEVVNIDYELCTKKSDNF